MRTLDSNISQPVQPPPAARARASNQAVGFSLIELLMVVTATMIVAAMAFPVFTSIARNLRGGGDLQSLRSSVVLAKTRAAATFTRARVRVDTTARTFQLELWSKTGATADTWVVEGGTQRLSPNVNFGYGSISSPPPSTQAAIGQGAQCRPGATGNPMGGTAIANTACIVFNSRGIPVDTTQSPTSEGAFYINDGASAQSITVGRTGLIRGWRRNLTGTSTWKGL